METLAIMAFFVGDHEQFHPSKQGWNLPFSAAAATTNHASNGSV
jgi:hypothetical protein